MGRRPSYGGRMSVEEIKAAGARFSAIDDLPAVMPEEAREAIAILRELTIEEANQARDAEDHAASARLHSNALAYLRALSLVERIGGQADAPAAGKDA